MARKEGIALDKDRPVASYGAGWASRDVNEARTLEAEARTHEAKAETKKFWPSKFNKF